MNENQLKTTLKELREIRLCIDRAIDGNKSELHKTRVMMKTGAKYPSKAALRGASKMIDALIRYETMNEKIE